MSASSDSVALISLTRTDCRSRHGVRCAHTAQKHAFSFHLSCICHVQSTTHMFFLCVFSRAVSQHVCLSLVTAQLISSLRSLVIGTANNRDKLSVGSHQITPLHTLCTRHGLAAWRNADLTGFEPKQT